MGILNAIRKLFENEGFTKIRKYIEKPAIVTAIVAGGVAFIVIMVCLISGKLEDIIVSMNMRYNSPVFIFMGFAFIIVQIGSLGYGIFLSLRKYRRPGGKGLFNVNYPKGNSYRTLVSVLNLEQK